MKHVFRGRHGFRGGNVLGGDVFFGERHSLGGGDIFSGKTHLSGETLFLEMAMTVVDTIYKEIYTFC